MLGQQLFGAADWHTLRKRAAVCKLVHACARVVARLRVRTHTHTHTHTATHTHQLLLPHTQPHSHTHIHIHTRTHTHTHLLPVVSDQLGGVVHTQPGGGGGDHEVAPLGGPLGAHLVVVCVCECVTVCVCVCVV